MMVAGEAQHHQVRLGVVAAPEHPETMMDVELAFGAGNAASLTAASPLGDQQSPAGLGQLGSSGPAVVPIAQALAQ